MIFLPQHRKSFRGRALGWTVAVLVGAGCHGGELPGGVDTFLLLTIEGLAADDTGAGGDPDARTPCLDRLARSGLQAVDAHVPSPSPRIALASILTGRPPAEHGLRHPDLALGESVTVAEIVRRRGVRTAAFAGTAIAGTSHGLGRGFDRHETRLDGPSSGRTGEPWREPGFRSAGSLARSLDSWLAEDPETPALAWTHLGESVAWEADEGLGKILRAVAARGTFFVVVTATDDDRVPFAVAGPGVPAGTLRGGRTAVADAAPILAAPLVGADALRRALADPPADRIVRSPSESDDFAFEADLASARRLDREGRVGEARAAYEATLAREPELVGARLRAAELARRTGDLDGAVRHLEPLLARAPEGVEARTLLGRVLAARGDRRAEEIVAPLLAAAPDHAGALVAAAEAAIAVGDPVGAVEHYRHALAVAGDGPELLLDIGRGLSRVGLHREAVDTVHRALERGDRTPAARYTLAWVLEQAERFPESVHEYSLLIRDHPDFLPPYRNLGVLMARDGEVERAIRLWEQGLVHHPDDPGLLANVAAAREALAEATFGS